MSYFKHDGEQSGYLVDRLPIYIFPAFVGSGRILLGMALAGITTAVMLHSRVGHEMMFWGLAVSAYASSLVLVVSGIYAVNVLPPRRKGAQPLPGLGSRPEQIKLVGREQADTPPVDNEEERRTRIGKLLVETWELMSAEQLARAEREQDVSGRSLSYVLAAMGLLTDERLEQILSLQAAAADPWHDAPRRG